MSFPVQLLVYRFGADAGFEGHLVGALERIEAGGSLKVLDVLFVGSDAESGEIFAIDLHGGSAGGMVAPLLGFRLDVQERRRRTKKTLAAGDGMAELIEQLGATLERGDALAAVLVGHEWARAVEDAVERTGGGTLVNTFVVPTSFGDLHAELLAAAGGGSARTG
jgi:hypothetical protein